MTIINTRILPTYLAMAACHHASSSGSKQFIQELEETPTMETQGRKRRYGREEAEKECAAKPPLLLHCDNCE